MSLTQSSDASTARQARQVLKQFTAHRTGRTERGRDRKVRRESYDVDDDHAKVFSRIADGSRAGGLGWVDDLVQLAEEYDLQHRKPGERGPLMASGVRVLRILCQRFLRFDTGQLDPAVRTIANVTGYTYKTVHAALKRLKAHGFLDWVRRTRKTDNEEQAGPQREQVSNAYYFGLTALPRAVLQRWKDLRDRRRRRQTVEPAPGAEQGTTRLATPVDPELASVLARVGALVESANPERGEYTHSGDQGRKESAR